MTDKPTGPAAAAREINLLVHKSVRFVKNPDDPELPAVTIDVTSEDIEAIITKHCPADKAVEKLVEALQFCIAEFQRVDKLTPFTNLEPEWWLAWGDVNRRANNALASYKEYQE